MDGTEELILLVRYLILFILFHCKGCFKDFPVIECAYVACFKVALWFAFTLCGLIVFMVYWATTYSEPFLYLDVGKGSEYLSAECKANVK